MIIVLTPIKNEEWILEQFLSVCSQFADHIIIADQNSTDRSREISAKFSKVYLIENNCSTYDEAGRQNLLINTARELFGSGNLLIGLDADEILSADSINSNNWNLMRNAEPGTVFRFEKPTIFFDTSKTIRYFNNGWPLAYKDDGAEHKPTIIHSTRIPTPIYAKQIYIKDIKFLHLCFVRRNIQFSKNRYYCIIENLNCVTTLRQRRNRYKKIKPNDYIEEGKLSATDSNWYSGWKDIGIYIDDFAQDTYYWMDFEALRIFNKYGVRRFYNDKIWHFDWELCRKEALAQGKEGIQNYPIQKPTMLRVLTTNIFFTCINWITETKRFFVRFIKGL